MVPALRDLAERRLKNLIRPERVYALVVPGLPADFPPLKTLDVRAQNLPMQLTSFVGGEQEMDVVKTMLCSSRLVTLTAAGGAGSGKGSEVIVTLPREGLASIASVPSADATTAHATPLDVLIVDDNRDAADSLRVLLELDAHRVRVCYDGPDAIEQVRKQRFDVALIDIGLPTIDGYEVAHAACMSDVEHRPLLVALTGWGAEADKAKARAAGFDRHLTKPVKSEDLAAVMALR